MHIEQSRRNALLLALLFAAWMIPGLLGRDPWKADEAYSFGLVLNMAETGDWVVPTLGSEPFMEKPPIFYITSALFTKVLSPPLEMHEAARAACIFYLLLTLLCAGLASRELNGAGTGWITAVLLLGCIGLVHTAHLLMTDNALLAGYAMGIYGLALGLRKPWLGGLICGMGSGLAFLSKGLLGPGLIGVTVLCLPVFFKVWRSRAYFYLLSGIGIGIMPWLVIWPCLLYQRSPALFKEWFWNNNLGRFLGTSPYIGPKTGPLYLVNKIPYFAWPVWPLALWAIWKERKGALRNPAVGMPLLAFAIAMLVLCLSGQRREVYALPFLAPLAILAGRVIGDLPARAARAANVFTFSIVSLAVVASWLGWLAVMTGTPAILLTKIQATVPTYVPGFQAGAFAAALAGTLGWVWLVRWHRPESKMAGVHWGAGVALLYLLGMTLWLPVSNSNMSYRKDFAGLRETLGDNPGVVASQNLGEPQRAVVHYYARLKTWRQEAHAVTNCNWILIEGEDRPGQQPQPPDVNWRQAWEGRHHRELFRLYRREAKIGVRY